MVNLFPRVIRRLKNKEKKHNAVVPFFYKVMLRLCWCIKYDAK